MSIRGYGRLDADPTQPAEPAMSLSVDRLFAGPIARPECAAALADIRTGGYEFPNVINGRLLMSEIFRIFPRGGPRSYTVVL